MHVLGLKKNLVSVAMLEDLGYDLVFSEGKVFLRHRATGQVNKIGVHVKNLYKHDVDGCVALSSKVRKAMRWDIGESWHTRLGHLHHSALRIM